MFWRSGRTWAEPPTLPEGAGVGPGAGPDCAACPARRGGRRSRRGTRLCCMSHRRGRTSAAVPSPDRAVSPIRRDGCRSRPCARRATCPAGRGGHRSRRGTRLCRMSHRGGRTSAAVPEGADVGRSSKADRAVSPIRRDGCRSRRGTGPCRMPHQTATGVGRGRARAVPHALPEGAGIGRGGAPRCAACPTGEGGRRPQFRRGRTSAAVPRPIVPYVMPEGGGRGPTACTRRAVSRP
ncbi:hypothetical protein M2161_007779 [Streptomyces sp. SAI-133]|nr:hypothetical protein [Streptomyces sp. SAI-133]